MTSLAAETTGLQEAWSPSRGRTQPDARTGPKSAICEEATQVCAEQYGKSLRAIVLTGSLAREEATFVEEANGWSLLGDVDLLLIFSAHTALPSRAATILLCRRIEERLRPRGVQAQITVHACNPNYLCKLRPHIFAYELRRCGQVVWGEPHVLSLIPDFSPADIPLEDAWRLLCNRMIELLEVAVELKGRPEALPRAVYYRTAKLFLDEATSFLLFAGAYQPSYRERAQSLRRLAENQAEAQERPFDLPRFAQRVIGCTRSKLTGAEEQGASWAFWDEAVGYAQLLWRWELHRLTGGGAPVGDRELMKRWMRLQPPYQRARGWLHVLRSLGWDRSRRQRKRWGKRAWQASPRLCVYAAASELFFRLPTLLSPASPTPWAEANWQELHSWLPAVKDPIEVEESLSWRRLVADIVWNYREFLEGTRA